MKSSIQPKFIHISSLILALVLGGGIIDPSTASATSIKNTSKISSKTTPKISQVFRQNAVLRAGETIDLKLNSNETLYVGKGERKAVDLVVDRDVVSDSGIVLIPEGAIISGEFIPVSGGSKFIARTLSSRGGTVRMSGESDLINDVKDPRESGIGSILGDAAIGAVAGTILGGIFGDRSISTEKILGGAVVGGVIGNVTAPQVVVIEPSTPIAIVTRRNLTFRTQDN